jgi:hypothetical protein
MRDVFVGGVYGVVMFIEVGYFWDLGSGLDITAGMSMLDGALT